MSRRLLLTALAVLAALPAAAAADTPVAAAPGAVNVAAGGGYVVWAQPGEDTGWQLVVRTPGGAVARPPIGDFAGPPQVSIGSDRYAIDGRRLLAVYGRDDGDLYAYDLRAGTERRVRGLNSRTYRESAPSIEHGNWAFVRSGGRRSGLYAASAHRGPHRIATERPARTQNNGSRVAYATSRAVVVRRLSGDSGTLRFATGERPRSVVLTRYRVGWLLSGGRVFQTTRIGGSGGPFQPTVQAAARPLPPSAQSLALERDRISLFSDAAGVSRIDPPLF